MSQPRWRRLLPETSQLWILAAVLVVIFFGVSFFNLAAEKTRATSKLQEAQQRVDILVAQNGLLAKAAAEGERGDNIDELARRYFGYSLKDETRFVAPAVAATTFVPMPAPNASPEGPLWQSLWGWLGSLHVP
jgi:hypothetical protein